MNFSAAPALWQGMLPISMSVRFQSKGWMKWLFALLFIAISLISARATTQFDLKSASSVVTTPQVRAELLAYAPQGVGVGQPVWLGLQIQHQPQWHTYWKNSGDSGQPTELQWTLPEGIQAGPVQWPVPKKIWIGSLANYGYEDTVLLPVPLEVSALFKPDLLRPDVEIKLKAVWLVCKQECIPEEGSFSLRLPVAGSTALHKAAFEAAQQRMPQDLKLKATATIEQGQLALKVPDLPPALRGKVLQLFPETPEVLENGAMLDSERGNSSSKPPAKASQWSQAWQASVWTASFPLSAQRSASPQEMPLVLTADGKTAYRVVAQVQGNWPAVAPPAQVSPALAAALAAQAQAAAQPVQASGQGVSSLWLALALALVGGVILNLMPCVLPVLAIKVFGFAKAPDARSRVAGGVAYTVGVLLSFVALGALMLALRAGGQALGWGFQLQSPAVVAALALLFTLIALNLLGVFEVSHILPSGVAQFQANNPKIDSFLTGVLAVAVASPCTAPFMGASLGYALGLPAWQALAVFAALGLGMALPYLLISMMPALARLLPRPGAWMDSFKTFMAFPMFATVVWLVWVLGQQSGIDGAAALLALLVLVALMVWALGLSGRARALLGALSVALLAAGLWTLGPTLLKDPEQAALPSDANWQTWDPSKVPQYLAQNKPVFVDFTAAWCVTCQYNKKTTLSDAQVLQSFAAKNVQLLRADWTRRDPAITQALAQLGRSGVPVYVLYKPGSNPVVMSEILSVTQLQSELGKL